MTKRRPRDVQRARVYAFSWSIPAAKEPCSLALAREIAEDVFPDNPPTIEYTRRLRTTGHANLNHRRIILADDASMRTKTVILHELAHFLTPTDVASHGPEFMANYIDLLARYTDTPGDRLMDAAYVAGVTVAPCRYRSSFDRSGNLARIKVQIDALRPLYRNPNRATLVRDRIRFVAQGEIGNALRLPTAREVQLARKNEPQALLNNLIGIGA